MGFFGLILLMRWMTLSRMSVDVDTSLEWMPPRTSAVAVGWTSSAVPISSPWRGTATHTTTSASQSSLPPTTAAFMTIRELLWWSKVNHFPSNNSLRLETVGLHSFPQPCPGLASSPKNNFLILEEIEITRQQF